MKLRPSFTVAAFAAIALQGCATMTNDNTDYNDLPAAGRAKLAMCYREELGKDHTAEIKRERPQLDTTMRGFFQGVSDEEYGRAADDAINEYTSKRICAEKLHIDKDSIPVPVPE